VLVVVEVGAGLAGVGVGALLVIGAAGFAGVGVTSAGVT